MVAIFILDLYYHPRDFSDRISLYQKHERSLFASIVNNVAYKRACLEDTSKRRTRELLLKLDAQYYIILIDTRGTYRTRTGE